MYGIHLRHSGVTFGLIGDKERKIKIKIKSNTDLQMEDFQGHISNGGKKRHSDINSVRITTTLPIYSGLDQHNEQLGKVHGSVSCPVTLLHTMGLRVNLVTFQLEGSTLYPLLHNHAYAL